MIKVCVFGASGRLGRSVLDVAKEFSEVIISAAVVSASSSLCGEQACVNQVHDEVSYTSDMDSALAASDVVIDFSLPEASLEICRKASNTGTPVVVCTTGFTATQVAELRLLSESMPMLLAPNTSIGVFALKELSILASKILGPDFQIEIMELHHKHKKDAPSGTALSVAEGLCQPQLLVKDRSANSAERGSSELGIASLRGGDVAGEHTVYFLGRGERLELTHRANNRDIFARGALRAALRLQKMPEGLYSMSDVIESI